MPKQKNFPDRQSESVRCKILNSYLRTIEDSFIENRYQLKLINYGTGSGKTHQLFKAISKTIKEHLDIQIIGIYVAPLREHLSVPTSVVKQYPDIPVYILNSLEMKTTDEYIKLYKKWLPLILKNAKFWKLALSASYREKVEESKQKLKTAKGVINRLEYIKKVGFGDEEFNKSETKKARRQLNDLLESFLEFIIKCELEPANYPEGCLKLIEIFFPLYLLREKSGILMLTYDKFETKIPYFKHNGETWVKKSNYLDKYVTEGENNSKKFIFAFDEQEDGYQIMLKKKIDIISPQDMAINNALSSIIRELSILFSTQNNENRNLLNFIDRNKGAINEFQEHFEKGKILSPKLQEYAPIYQRLTFEEGNSTDFLQEVISIYKGLENSLEEIVEIFNREENSLTLDFEMLSRVFSKFEKSRSLLIPQTLYNKISDDLMNIFSYNNLYIYNSESLEKLFLDKTSGGHVHITEEKVSDETSLAELIYGILATRSQIILNVFPNSFYWVYFRTIGRLKQ